MLALMLVFAFAGCDLTPSNFLEVKAEDMIELPTSEWNNGSADWPWFPIVLKHIDKEVTFECSLDEGYFLLRDFSKPLLSEMSEKECDEFIVQNGVEIPEGFSGSFVKNVIQSVEKNPYWNLVVSWDVPYIFSNKIKAVVNDYYGARHSKNAIAKPGDTIYWEHYDGTPNNYIYKGFIAKAFVDIVLKKDDSIIGYAVVEINQNGGANTYGAKISALVIFPKIGGEYQNVTEKYVKAAIKKIKEKIMAESKTTAKTTLETYAQDKGKENYTAEDWAFIEKLVANGKTAVNSAADMDGVVTAVLKTKKAIDAVSASDMIIFLASDWSSGSIYIEGRTWTGFPIMFKYAKENTVFECSIDKGNFVLNGTQYVKTVVAQSGDIIEWWPYEVGSSTRIERVLIDVVIKTDNQTVRNTVVEIYSAYHSIRGVYVFNARLLG